MKARLPREYQNSTPNMNQMVKKAQKMQEDIAKVQEELETKEFTKQVGGGALELVMTGDKQLKSVTLKPEVVDPEDIEMLQDLIISGVNEILKEVDDYGA
ncbi:MAG: YbaB/EbfC family nucleoid-associated protein, partial [Oscillospiraceae bacterium]